MQHPLESRGVDGDAGGVFTQVVKREDEDPLNFSFWTHSHMRAGGEGERRSSDDIYDGFGFVDRVKLFALDSLRHGGHLCVICATHRDQTLGAIAQHIFDVHGPLAERGTDNKQHCLYSQYLSHTAVCSRISAGQLKTRLSGFSVIGRITSYLEMCSRAIAVCLSRAFNYSLHTT
jgi:hypothetical protein